MTFSFDVPVLSMELTQQLVLSPSKELILFAEMVLNIKSETSQCS